LAQASGASFDAEIVIFEASRRRYGGAERALWRALWREDEAGTVSSDSCSHVSLDTAGHLLLTNATASEESAHRQHDDDDQDDDQQVAGEREGAASEEQ